jgi:hypothetical protein
MDAWTRLVDESRDAQMEFLSHRDEADSTRVEGAAGKAWDKRLRHFLRKYFKKFKGQRAVAPGPSSWRVALWSAAGTYVLVFMLTSINWRVRSLTRASPALPSPTYNRTDWETREKTEKDSSFFLLINSMGAVAATIAAAPTSPLAQPRNIFFGHLIAGTLTLMLDYLCNPKFGITAFPVWVAAPLCPALSMGVQARLGILHPPSCSACVIYTLANGGDSNAGGAPYVQSVRWFYIACPLLLDSVLLIMAGSIFNNLNKTRSYPLYW